MDSIFLLNQVERSNFLQHIIQSFSCTYICLWSYIPQTPYSCLLFVDGVYHEQNNQATSSSCTVARSLFDVYIQSIFMMDNGRRIPGLAFKNNLPYLELNDLNLQRLASTKVQLQFYQEARIKSAIFMGCKTGEIELGFSNETRVNMEIEMKNLFPGDFSRQRDQNPQPLDQNQPSSSSSSLRSLSMGSPEPSSFLFNIPNTSYIQETPFETHVLQEPMRPISSTPPVQQANIQSPNQILNTQIFPIESENDQLTKAILAVLSSSSPSSSSCSHPQPKKPSAFTRYRSVLGPTMQITRKPSMLKRAIKFFSSLTLTRNQEQLQQGSSARPLTTQLHHMISERRRREKLNESFQALRTLLPQGTKRDKASVLTSTTEYLASLKAQVEELSQRNRVLESQLPLKKPIDIQETSSESSNERLGVQVTNVDGESTSRTRIVDLQVIVRGECNMLDLVIRVMEFLKQDENVNLMSIEAQPLVVNSNSIHRVVLRLKIEGADWDRSAFQEAVKRVVADLAQ